MQRKWIGFGIGVMAMYLVLLVGCGKDKSPGSKAPVPQKDVVATVGDKVITLSQIDEKISRMPAHYQKMLQGRKAELLDDMVLEILLYDEAKKKGLEEDKEVKEILEEAHKKIVISKLIQNEIEEKATVSDKEARNYYDTHGDEFATQERMKVSHILVNSEKEAKTILTELANGASFEELAKEKSEDTSSDKGGDIGYFTKGQVVPEFEKAASKLEIGQISEIVKSEFGYHIIKLTDKKPAQTQDFTGVSNKIKSKLLADKKKEEFDKLADRLKAGVAININKELLEKKEETSLMSQRKAPMPKKETLEVAKEKEVVGEVKTNE